LARKLDSLMPSISIETKYIRPEDDSLPGLAIQITWLVDSYMLWVSTTEGVAENVWKAPLQGSLCRDWACAMPPFNVSALWPPSCESSPNFRWSATRTRSVRNTKPCHFPFSYIWVRCGTCHGATTRCVVHFFFVCFVISRISCTLG
jgi:hypothetical protein